MADQSTVDRRRAPGLGPAIREARVRRGWSQEELAFQMGTDQSVVGKWERGTRVPDLSTLQRLAAVLGYDAVVVQFKVRSAPT